MYAFIINRDLLTWPRNMSKYLADCGCEVVIVDNASSYEPLLDWYSLCDYNIIRLKENRGHGAVWTLGIMDRYVVDRYYVVSDPDLEIGHIPHDWFDVLREGFDIFDSALKVGFSLDEKFVPQDNPSWELDKFCLGVPTVYYSQPLRNGFYAAGVDTTFALYDKKRNGTLCVRKGQPYTAIHLPWHITLDSNNLNMDSRVTLMNDELFYYYMHASSCSTTSLRLRNSGFLKKYALTHNIEWND